MPLLLLPHCVLLDPLSPTIKPHQLCVQWGEGNYWYVVQKERERENLSFIFFGKGTTICWSGGWGGGGISQRLQKKKCPICLLQIKWKDTGRKKKRTKIASRKFFFSFLKKKKLDFFLPPFGRPWWPNPSSSSSRGISQSNFLLLLLLLLPPPQVDLSLSFPFRHLPRRWCRWPRTGVGGEGGGGGSRPKAVLPLLAKLFTLCKIRNLLAKKN